LGKANERRGFKGKSSWQQSTLVLKTNGDKVSPKPIAEARGWLNDEASVCTVRINKELRDALKAQVGIERKLRSKLGVKLFKETDAVNSAVFEWIYRRRCEHILVSRLATLEFESSFDRNDAMSILGAYGKYLNLLEKDAKEAKTKFSLKIELKKPLRKSLAFRNDLTIVSSLLASYKVHE
jgi:hypothetical protein